MSGTFEVRAPATGALLATLPRHGADEARAAVDRAARLLDRPEPSLEARRDLLDRFAATHESLLESLAATIHVENGKPLAEARDEVRYAAGFYREARRHLPRLAPRVLPERPRGLTWTVHARAAGVAALITPFNFPLAMLAKKLSGALAAGCPAVIKPSERTPLTPRLLLHHLEPHLEPGRVQLLHGDAPALAEVLCTHPAVRVLSFTGSTAVGRHLAGLAAPHMKRLALELGGNAPFIVFADADLEAASNALVANKLRSAGQTCVCANRVLVQAGVADAFIGALSARLKQADPIGPLIDAAAWARVRAVVEDAVACGARLVHGTLPVTPPFFAPVVLDGTPPESRAFREEVFGPVFSLTRFRSDDEALALAGGANHGLAAYAFSANPERLARVGRALPVGHLGLNSGTGPTPEAPFGGRGWSGLGREGGEEGVLEFVEWQTLAQP